jgi:hypothetical protein
MKLLNWRGPRGVRLTISLDRWLDRAGYLTTMETGIHAPAIPFTGGCGCCQQTGSTAATTITTETGPEPSGLSTDLPTRLAMLDQLLQLQPPAEYPKPHLLPPFQTSTSED